MENKAALRQTTASSADALAFEAAGAALRLLQELLPRLEWAAVRFSPTSYSQMKDAAERAKKALATLASRPLGGERDMGGAMGWLDTLEGAVAQLRAGANFEKIRVIHDVMRTTDNADAKEVAVTIGELKAAMAAVAKAMVSLETAIHYDAKSVFSADLVRSGGDPGGSLSTLALYSLMPDPAAVEAMKDRIFSDFYSDDVPATPSPRATLHPIQQMGVAFAYKESDAAPFDVTSLVLGKTTVIYDLDRMLSPKEPHYSKNGLSYKIVQKLRTIREVRSTFELRAPPGAPPSAAPDQRVFLYTVDGASVREACEYACDPLRGPHERVAAYGALCSRLVEERLAEWKAPLQRFLADQPAFKKDLEISAETLSAALRREFAAALDSRMGEAKALSLRDAAALAGAAEQPALSSYVGRALGPLLHDVLSRRVVRRSIAGGPVSHTAAREEAGASWAIQTAEKAAALARGIRRLYGERPPEGSLTREVLLAYFDKIIVPGLAATYFGTKNSPVANVSCDPNLKLYYMAEG